MDDKHLSKDQKQYQFCYDSLNIRRTYNRTKRHYANGPILVKYVISEEKLTENSSNSWLLFY